MTNQTVKLKNDLVEIKFTYSSALVGKVKSLSNRKWVPAQKFWTAPPIFENLEKLLEWGFEFDDKTQNIWDKLNQTNAVSIASIPGFEKMYPFQLKGVEFIESKNGRALIGDEMGLGKTIQALGYLGLHPELRPAVIVCPASLKLNWKKEVNQWMPNESIHIINGKKDATPTNADIYIINYDILSVVKMEQVKGSTKKKKIVYCREDLISLDPQCLILDESHYIKNSKANRSKAVQKLAKGIQSVICLTGTPIINRPIEFFPTLKLLDPVRWSSFWNYAHKYCGAKHNGFGWDFTGSSNPDALYEAIKSTMIRRLKSEVLPDLPAKVRTVIPLEITNRREYNNKLRELEASDSPAIQLTRIEALKQVIVAGKIKACINWISDFLESDQKLVVFCTHKKVIDALMTEFGDIAVKIDGSCSQDHRQLSVELFQNNPDYILFVGNIKAAGVGLTLTAASSTCFIELGWTSGEHDQAEDRVHRIGQDADSVNAYYLLGQDTIDMEIAELLDSKREVLDAVLDGKETEETSLLTELMNRILGDSK